MGKTACADLKFRKHTSAGNTDLEERKTVKGMRSSTIRQDMILGTTAGNWNTQSLREWAKKVSL